MSIIYSKANFAVNAGLEKKFGELTSLRQQHDNIQRAALANMGSPILANQAALLPQDAYRELDSITQRVFQNDEGRGYMADLMGVSKTIDIGKTAYIYRQASDKTGLTTRSISGQVPETISKTNYDYDGDPVPMFTTGYGREWREQRAFQSEGFDAMFDDQENSMRDITEDIATYMLWGDSAISVRNYAGQGIATHRSTQKIDLGTSGSNINLTQVGTAASNDDIIAFWTRDFAQILDNNYCPDVDVVWVSPQIRRRLQEPYANSQGFFSGTLEKFILEFGRIKSFKTTFELGREGNGTGDYNVNTLARANQFFAYKRSQQVICPLVGMGISNIAIPRVLPTDNVNNMIMSAMGLRVRADANGRSQVFYGSNVT